MKTTYQAIEDNGGGLHLAVFDEADECIYFHSGFEQNLGDLVECVEQLKMGEDPANWEGNDETPMDTYNNLTSYEYGWQIVADDEGIYPDVMGAAARREFGTAQILTLMR